MAPPLDVLLLTPPLTDPTGPYHSLVYLASFARANGFRSIEIRDTNIEALRHCAQPAVLKTWTAEWENRRASLSRKAKLNSHDQLEYHGLTVARALDVEAPQKAISVLSDPRTFYDYGAYREAVQQLAFWIECLSNEGYPFQFSRRFLVSGDSLFSLASIADLTNPDLLERAANPFTPYFYDILFPELSRRRPAVIGLTVTYTSQLIFALWLIRQLRKLLPDTSIICGGTEISDIWKYIVKRELFAELFSPANACVIGEGETAFVRILHAISEGRLLTNIPNVVSLEEGLFDPKLLTIQYEDLNAIPSPEYGLMDHSKYLSPHPLIFYSPTRGCYWNKCTFCDYGLNFGTPTSPWRQRHLDLIIEDLRVASHYSSFIYFSVDVLAPSALLKLAQAIIDAKININWSAEIRLEKFFSRERCTLLRQSGCVAISVGFESGCQRVLDLIKKGTSLEHIALTIRNFSEAGIAVQMMGFTDFPSETYNEALESLSYLETHQSYWTVATLGNFILTPGAIVARQPKDFGLGQLAPPLGADIGRFLAYDDVSHSAKTDQQQAQLAQEKRRLIRTEFDRPFAGGIDSAHSIFYYSRYGLAFPQTVLNGGAGSEVSDDVAVELGGILIEHEKYDLDALLSRDGIRELQDSFLQKRQMPTARCIATALTQQIADVSPTSLSNPVFIRRDGVCIPCSEEVWEILRRVDGTYTLNEILTAIYPAENLLRFLYQPLLSFIRRYGLVVCSGKATNSASWPTARS